MKKFRAVVSYKKGTHTFTTGLGDQISLPEIISHFEDECNRSNKVTDSVVLSIDLIAQNADGSERIDENGNRVTTRIYERKRN